MARRKVSSNFVDRLGKQYLPEVDAVKIALELEAKKLYLRAAKQWGGSNARKPQLRRVHCGTTFSLYRTIQRLPLKAYRALRYSWRHHNSPAQSRSGVCSPLYQRKPSFRSDVIFSSPASLTVKSSHRSMAQPK